MSAGQLHSDIYLAAVGYHNRVPDPGDANTISLYGKSHVLCLLVPAGSETRLLQAATSLPIGTRLKVYNTTANAVTFSSLTNLDQSGNTSFVLNGIGDYMELEVLPVSGVNYWRKVVDPAVTSMDLDGSELILDANADTSLTADTDDQVDLKIGGTDYVVFKEAAGADAAVTRSIQEIAFTAPVDTTGTNIHNALNIDVEISNSTGGTNTVNAIAVDAVTADAQVTGTVLLIGTGWNHGVSLGDDVNVTLGTGLDVSLRWSTGDASNHALALGLGDSNQSLHITDLGAIATDWNVSADTHPTVYVHSNTTPATDYMTIGAHDGTIGHINVAGGTTLSLDIAGTAEVTVTAAGLVLATGNSLQGDAIVELTSANGVTIDGLRVKDGQIYGAQGNPVAEVGAATITAADILAGIVTVEHAAGATVALTLDTGTAMDTALSAYVATGQYLDWTLINLSDAALDTATVTLAAGHSVVGTMVCQSEHATTGGIHGNAIMLRSRRTATNTWITYRLA